MHWETLGLAPDADERDIKRAYARLLKTHRPDEDAQAFQRLREAYEGALEQARWRAGQEEEDDEQEPADAPETGSLFTQVPVDDTEVIAVETMVPLSASAPQVQEQSRVETLLDADLDEGLAQARREGLEPLFQRGLLLRCLRAEHLDLLDWAYSRLGWMSVRQPEYLPRHEMELLASRLGARTLAQLREALEQHQEMQAADLLRTALASDWLAPLDRRDRFLAQVFEVLGACKNWTPAYLEHICSITGWSEAQGYLPCPLPRWEALCRHVEACALEQSLREHLSVPATSEPQRAAWFLFGNLSNARRRQWADRFTLSEWQACATLADEVAEHPQVQSRLQRICLPNWQAWSPQGYWGWGYIYLWLMLSFVLGTVFAFDPRETERDSPAILILIAFVVLVPVLLWLAQWGMVLWSRIARALAMPDVMLSQYLLPQGLVRQGSGVLLLRHLVPCAIAAGLVLMWGTTVPLFGPIMALLTFTGAVRFADIVTRGDSPATWLYWARERLGLTRAKLKRAVWIGIGLVLLILIRLIFN